MSGAITPPSDRQKSARRGGPLRFALAIVALILILTLALGAFVYFKPVRIATALARSGLERAGLEKETVASPAGDQTVFVGGTGATSLVFLHGVGVQAGSWVQVAGDLAQEHRVLAVDLAGHGDSEPQTGPLDFEATLEGLHAVLEAHAAGDGVGDQEVILVGNSFGGWTALRYALEHPDAVDRVILVNAAGLRAELPEGVTLTPSTREEVLALFRALGSDETPAGFVLDDVIEEIAVGPTPRIFPQLGEEELLDGRLASVSMPVDLIWGLRDELTPPALADRFRAELPPGSSRMIGLEECGHIPQQQCPSAFVAAVRELVGGS